jgi:hypothetical protein
VDRSTVTWRAVVRMFGDTVRLAWRMYVRDGYRVSRAEPELLLAGPGVASRQGPSVTDQQALTEVS